MKKTSISKKITSNKQYIILPLYVLFVLITQSKKGIKFNDIWSRILKWYYVIKNRI
ncbi:MAG: hypothetical protein K0S41_1537 [Anaerocolumna sp.]|jgi:hypothetical protein|nr:hypothetical protein [Anaerocolumna sp.]